MASLKVFGGTSFVGGKQVRVVVGTYTKKQAAELFGMTMYSFNRYTCETGNATEVQICTGTPHTVFYRDLDDWDGPYMEFPR